MRSVVQRIAASAFRIDRHALEPVFVIRSAVGVTVALLGGFLTGVPLYTVAAGLGAMTAGFGSLQGVYRTRVATMLGMAVAMAFSTLSGSLVSHSTALSVLAVMLWGLAYGLVAALGPAAAAIAVNATIALIVFEHLPQPFGSAVGCAGMVLAGGAVQTLLVVVLWPIQRYPQERQALARAYRDLASFATADPSSALVPSSTSLRTVRATLSDPRPFGRRAAAAAFQTLLDEAERIRASLALSLTSGGEPYARARETVAAVLRAIAHALEDAQAPGDDALYARLSEPPDDPALRALYGQLRAAWRSAGVPLRGIAIPRRIPYPRRLPAFDEPLAVLRANLRAGAPFGRHAIRLAVVLGAAALAGDLFSYQRGYWVTLTAALVLRPDFTTTFARGFARIGGTIVGVIAATAIVLAVPDTPHVYLALAIFFAAAGYAAFQLNYAIFSLTITAYVVFLLALLGVPEQSAVLNRLLATAVGGIFAMLSYVVWPTWEARNTRARLLALVESDLAYIRTMLEGIALPPPRDTASLQRRRAEIWNTRAAAEESLERMLSEPSSTHDIDAQAALGIMAATQRLALANTALSSMYADPGMPAFPALSAFARALAPVRPQRADGLRDAYNDFERSLEDPHDPAAQALLVALDLAVDSINVIVERWRAAAGETVALRESPGRA